MQLDTKSGRGVKLNGIVVTGGSKAAAIQNYRNVALGSSVVAYADEGKNFVFLSNADSALALMNPATGEMDVEPTTEYTTEDFDFHSESSGNDTVKVEYTVCTAGCGSHVIADSKEMLAFCPVCASSLDELDEEALASLSMEGEDDFDIIDEEMSDEEETNDEEEMSEDDMESESKKSCSGIVVAAASLQEAAKMFVEASADASKRITLSDSEGDSFVTHASADAEFNPVTGNAAEYNVVTASGEDDDEELNVTAGAKIEAEYLLCSSEECGMHVVASSDDVVFCPSCSSGLVEVDDEELSDTLKFVLSTDGEEDYSEMSDDEEEMSDDEEMDDEEDVDDIEDADMESEGMESECSDAASDDDFTAYLASLSADDEEGDDEEDDSEEEEDDSEEEEDDSEEEEDEESDLDMTMSDELSESSASSEEGKANDDQDKTVVQINALKQVSLSSGDLAQRKLEVAHCGSINGNQSWFAFLDGMPVAVATAVSAAKHAEIFNGPAFGKALIAMAAENGVEKALEDMGFKVLASEVSLDSFVEQEIVERVAEITTNVNNEATASANEREERLMAALSTAALGINRGFFAKVRNPVKDILVASLSAAGVRDANVIVDKAFAENSDEYHKALLGKTKEILASTLEVQNQLAEAVAGSNYMGMKSESSSLEDRLSTVGKAVTKQTVQLVSQSSSDEEKPVDANRIKRALSTLGQRRN